MSREELADQALRGAGGECGEFSGNVEDLELSGYARANGARELSRDLKNIDLKHTWGNWSSVYPGTRRLHPASASRRER